METKSHEPHCPVQRAASRGEGAVCQCVKEAEQTYDHIQLASNEWGNELMQSVAEQWFRDHEDCEFVIVYEHAGWYLGFRRDSSMWATANDQAVLPVPKPQPRGGYSGRGERREAQ